MAIITNTFTSYGAKGIREDLSDLISNIAPTTTPFQSNIAHEPTQSTFFEWQTDTLDTAAGTNKHIEGDDLGTTYSAITATVRIGNYCEIVEKDFVISRTEQKMLKAGRQDERGYQASLKAKAMKRDWETSLLQNSTASAGSTSAARRTGGLAAWIKTNISSSNTNSVDPVWTSAPTGARSDGTTRTFTETILKAVVKLCFDNGADPSILMVGSSLKQTVSSFAGIAALRGNLNATGSSSRATIIGAADVYLSDFGELAVTPNRFMPTNYAYLIDPTMARIRVFDDYQLHEMAKTGDATKYMLTYEAGLQIDNEKAFGIAADLS